MSFWDTGLGSVTGSAEQAFTKQFKNIPDNSYLRAKIKEFTIEETQNDRFLQIVWKIMDSEFEGAQVRQKIKVWDDDSNKRYKALNMFMYLHKLYGLQPADREPMPMDLLRFVNKPAGIKVQLTKPMPDTGNRYNWVSEVHKTEGFKSKVGKEEVEETMETIKPNMSKVTDLDDDIPF